jgi:hypothetical protein
MGLPQKVLYLNPNGSQSQAVEPVSMEYDIKETSFDSPTALLSSSMIDACKFLGSIGVEYEVKTPHHIKIGAINYFPTRQTIFEDGAPAKYKQKGLKFLHQILLSKGYCNG